MAHEKFKQGSEDELREWFCLVFRASLGFTLLCRSVFEEFCRSEPRQKYLWIYVEPQKTRSFQSLLFGEQELYRPNLGNMFSSSS